MNLVRTVVESADGRVVDALVARCCDQDKFTVFQIDGQDHPHLQCAVCTTSFCTTGRCEVPPRRAR